MANITLSPTLSRIAPSPTIAATQKARDLKASGADVISLSAGEPDFDTPDHVKAAAMEAIKRGETKYTAIDGIPELKDAIIKKFERDNGLSYSRTQISVAPGGKAIIFNALVATLGPGDEVIVPAPYWVSYPDMVRIAGAEPVIAPTREEDGFLLTPVALEAAITDKTRWLILNSPSNPSGAVYSKDALAALSAVLLKHPNVMVMTDDIYEKIIYDEATFATIASTEPELFNRTLTVNGASKVFAMTGWRIGYGAGPDPLIKAMAKVMSQSTSSPCSISQWATVAALNSDQSFLADWTAAFKRRRDMVVSMLNDAPGLSCATPAGAFYVYPHCGGVLGKKTPAGRLLQTDEDFADALLEDYGVAIVFGGAFGLSPHFRLSYAAADESVEEACRRIQAFCAGLS